MGQRQSTQVESPDAHGVQSAAELSTKRKIIDAAARLVDVIEPDYGLLDQLASLGVLTRREYSEVSNETTVYKRLDRLLERLMNKTDEQCRDFLLALQKTDQQHVVNFIQQRTDDGRLFGDAIPLSEIQLQHITFNGPRLIELIDSNIGFLAELAACGSITWSQKSELGETNVTSKRNRKLLDILSRRSVAHLRKFVDCLVAHRQSHLVPLFLNTGVVVNVDATLDETSVSDVTLAERQIVARFKASLPDNCTQNTAEQVASLIEELQTKTRSLGLDIQLVVFEKQNSVGSYLFCETSQSVDRLYSLFADKQLQHLLESIFTTLLSRGQRIVRVKYLTWTRADYEQCLRYFRTLSEIKEKCEPSSDSLCDELPLELTEFCLMRIFEMPFVGEMKRSFIAPAAVRMAYVTLATVCAFWRQTLSGWPQSNTRRWVRHGLQRRVRALCSPYAYRPKLIQTVPTEATVSGIAHLDDKIFVTYPGSDRIDIFADGCVERLNSIQVKDLKDPRDLVSCNDSGRLYVAGWSAGSSSHVWTVTTTNDDDDDVTVVKLLPRTPAERELNPRTLSVTASRLLVTTADELVSFTGDGDVGGPRVQLPDMDLHAVETARGTFVVCHYLPQPQISEVDVDGDTINAFAHQQQLLTWPCYLAPAADAAGGLFVADFNKSNVMLLSGDLRLRRIVIDGENGGLRPHPRRVCYVRHRRRLIVGDLVTAGVQVFALGRSASDGDHALGWPMTESAGER